MRSIDGVANSAERTCFPSLPESARAFLRHGEPAPAQRLRVQHHPTWGKYSMCGGWASGAAWCGDALQTKTVRSTYATRRHRLRHSKPTSLLVAALELNCPSIRAIPHELPRSETQRASETECKPPEENWESARSREGSRRGSNYRLPRWHARSLGSPHYLFRS